MNNAERPDDLKPTWEEVVEYAAVGFAWWAVIGVALKIACGVLRIWFIER